MAPNKNTLPGVKISTSPWLPRFATGWLISKWTGPGKELMFGTFWSLVANFIKFLKLWELDRKLHIFPSDLSIGWLEFVRTSKFWKLLAQLAGKDFGQSFTPACTYPVCKVFSKALMNIKLISVKGTLWVLWSMLC